MATFPDFPAEIRAPRGTRAGVSGFQVQFSSHDIFTPGDRLDALVAMNPAALVTNVDDLVPGGILVVNEDGFDDRELRLANLQANPLEDHSLDKYRLIRVPMTTLTRKAVEELGLSVKVADRCRNFFAMGLVYWLFGRDPAATLRFIRDKFGNKPDIAQANEKAMWAGWYYGETTEDFASSYRVDAAQLPAGTYRNIMGNQALAWGLLAAAERSDKELFLGTYPITPASDILHELSKFKNFGMCGRFRRKMKSPPSAPRLVPRSAGAMAVTTTSGPGIALKGEAMGLAVMLELPLIIVNVQRGGPSTGSADQDGTSRLVPGHVRPQRRMSATGHRGRQPGRLFRCRAGGVADRRAVHDAGGPLVRRLYRQRVGALADSRRGGPAADRDSSPRADRRRRGISSRMSVTSVCRVPGRCPELPD